MHAILQRFSCIPLANIEVYFRANQAGDLQIWFLPHRDSVTLSKDSYGQALNLQLFHPAAFSEKLRCSVRSLYTGWQDRS